MPATMPARPWAPPNPQVMRIRQNRHEQKRMAEQLRKLRQTQGPTALANAMSSVGLSNPGVVAQVDTDMRQSGGAMPPVINLGGRLAALELAQDKQMAQRIKNLPTPPPLIADPTRMQMPLGEKPPQYAPPGRVQAPPPTLETRVDALSAYRRAHPEHAGSDSVIPPSRVGGVPSLQQHPVDPTAEARIQKIFEARRRDALVTGHAGWGRIGQEARAAQIAQDEAGDPAHAPAANPFEQTGTNAGKSCPHRPDSSSTRRANADQSKRLCTQFRRGPKYGSKH